MLHHILATSIDANMLAVACHDVGCFVRAHPPGKGSVDSVLTQTAARVKADTARLASDQHRTYSTTLPVTR